MTDTSERVEAHIKKLAATEQGVRCGVCGKEVSGRAAACSICEAPYHCDCWKYNGGCAVYGCRAAPVPPEPFEVEIVIRGRASGGTARRVTAVAVVLVLVAGMGIGLWLFRPVGPVRTPFPGPGPGETPPTAASVPRASAGANPLSGAPTIEEFVKTSKGAAWEGKVFFLRSLAGTHDPKALRFLLEGLRADDEIGNVREAAAETLGQAGWKEAIPALEERVEKEKVATLKGEICLALHRLGSPRGKESMRLLMENYLEFGPGKFGDARFAAMSAARAAGRAGLTDLRPLIEHFLDDKDPWVVCCTCDALVQMKDRSVIPHLLKVMERKDASQVNAAASALLDLGAVESWPDIEAAVKRCPQGSSYLPYLRKKLEKAKR